MENVHNAFTKKLDKIDAVYRFTPTIEILMSLIDSPSSSVRDVAEHVDPAIASEILRVANSAYYSAGRWYKVTTIDRAILMIGFDTLSQIVFEMFMLALDGGSSSLDQKAFIQHSLLTAILSKENAPPGSGHGDELYLAGLLHDVGKAIIHTYFTENTSKIEEIVRTTGIPNHEAEKLVLGLDHAELGSMILTKWGFDPALISTVALHHSKTNELPQDVMIVMEANKKAKQVEVSVDIFKQNKPPVAVLRDILSSTRG